MIKAICFDLDGVYFTPEGKRGFEQSLKDLGVPHDKVSYALYTCQEMLSFVTGKMSEKDFWQFMRTYLGLSFTDEQFTAIWVKDYKVDAAVKNYISRLKAKDYRICVCSNNNPSRVQALDKIFHFLEDFDVAVFSYEVGDVKPSKEIFEELIKRSKVKSQQIVYSDDNPERLSGASELGINTFVYTDFIKFKQELEKLGVKI
jgi:HAD superfamily hydrolase (TIGR01509 family)